MTMVVFHLGVPDKLLYVCRLLRKASRQGARVRVVADEVECAQLDSALWTFEPSEFLPHARYDPAKVPHPSWAHTPIWLTQKDHEWPDVVPRASVLVNLDREGLSQVNAFDRVIEVVSLEDDDKEAARHRWRRYKALGLDCQHHQV